MIWKSKSLLSSRFGKRPEKRWKLRILTCILALTVFLPGSVSAHQQPTTIAVIDINPDKVSMRLEIPLSELELAFGHDVSENTATLIERSAPELKDYLKAHVRPVTADQPWSVEVTNIEVGAAEQTQSGPYQELIAHLNLVPPAGASTRQFSLNYDVIMHQVVTHKALVSIRNDWESGNVRETPVEAGVIAVDTATTRIYPLEINLEEGGLWQGFAGMVALGMQHIKEGTDHLLFLLVLLLPAPLLFRDKNWREFGGTRYSVARLLKIVTAFTVGHSITLLVGALGWLRLASQPVEVLIAVSILVSAVHAVRPIFAGREMYVAAGFGLVHGLAFATVLSNLNLGAEETALSILGFNIGIETMQIFVITLVTPWLILLSLTPMYKSIRIAGASAASIAAAAWILERVSGTPNAVANFVQNISEHAHFGVLGLALIAVFAYASQFIRNKNVPLNQTEGN